MRRPTERRMNSSNNEQHGPQSAADLFVAADVCRPGSDDLDKLIGRGQAEALRADHAANEYFGRSQAFDAVVAKAFGQVPIPLGAKERLLAALAADGEASSNDSFAPAESATLVPVRRAAPLTRRRWLAACGAAATSTAAGLAFYAWWQGRQRPDLSLEDILHSALAFHELPEAENAAWTTIAEQAPPAEFPLSKAIRTVRSIPRWRPLGKELLGRSGVAYEVAGRGEPRATVYVLTADGGLKAPLIRHLPAEPMHAPETTGGMALGAWREEGRIVCFVVAGDADRYRSFLSTPRDIA